MIQPKHIIISGYCGFTTVQELIDDHKGIKEQIKQRENQCDRLVNILYHYDHDHDTNSLPSYQSIQEEIEEMSHEMMSINM